MGVCSVLVSVGAEMFTGYAHTLGCDVATLLERPNNFDEANQKVFALLVIKRFCSFDQKVRPIGGANCKSLTLFSQLQRYCTLVVASAFFNQGLGHKS